MLDRDGPARSVGAMPRLSAHMRVGTEQHYFAIRWMEGVPLYSSGGYLDAGIGEHPAGSQLSIYSGLAAGGPFERDAFMIQGSYQLPNGVVASVRARTAFPFAPSTGVAVGLGYHELRP